MRGEDVPGDERFVYKYGSPPHARGRPDSAAQWADQPRITPACAGKTSAPSSTRRSSRDHPRMRGEDQIPCIPLFDDEGSPPHARGRHQLTKVEAQKARITPACAGKTAGVTFGSRVTCGSPPHARGRPENDARRPAAGGITDHPRMRGEDTHAPTGMQPASGSPPHARGRRPQ